MPEAILIAAATNSITGETIPLEWVLVDRVNHHVEYFNVLVPPAIPGGRPVLTLSMSLN